MNKVEYMWQVFRSGADWKTYVPLIGVTLMLPISIYYKFQTSLALLQVVVILLIVIITLLFGVIKELEERLEQSKGDRF